MIIKLPIGLNRSATFNVGPDQGKVQVETGKKTLVLDLYNENTVKLGLADELPAADMSGIKKMAVLIAAGVFVLVLALFLVLYRSDRMLKLKERLAYTKLEVELVSFRHNKWVGRAVSFI